MLGPGGLLRQVVIARLVFSRFILEDDAVGLFFSQGSNDFFEFSTVDIGKMAQVYPQEVDNRIKL